MAIGLALATLAGVTVLVALVSEVFVDSVQQAAVAFGMTPAFVGFIVVALVGGAAEMASAFSGARKNRLDLSVGIALGSASQIALFVAPVLVLLSYVIGPAPMDLQFWPGAVVMMLIATMTASLVTNSGRSAWFVGVLVLMVYLIFAMTLYLLPPGSPVKKPCLEARQKRSLSGRMMRAESHQWVGAPEPSACCAKFSWVVPSVFATLRSMHRDGGGNMGGALCGCDLDVTSIAPIDRRHDCGRVVPDGCAFCRSGRLVVAYAIVGAAPEGTDLIYFAFVNYTTLGYGDVMPVERWHLLGPMTAMNGVLLFGWSAAVIFAILQKVWMTNLTEEERV